MRTRIVGYMLDGEKAVPVYGSDYEQCMVFARWLAEPRNLEVERTSIRPGLLVATAFLGINRAPYPRKDLVLWETRVVRDGNPDPPLSYTSLPAARTGHWELVYTLYANECIPLPPHIRLEIEEHVPAGFRLEIGRPNREFASALG